MNMMIVALLLSIIAIRKAQRFRFLALYFLRKRRQGKSDSRGDGEQLSHGEDGRLGYIPDRKAGLNRCMKTGLCHPCRK